MQKRRFEKVAVTLLSIIMLMTSTGIVSSLASNVNESSSAPVSSTTQATSTTTAQETTSSTTSEATTVSPSTESSNIGDGTKENPFKISTVDELLAIGAKVNNVSSKNNYFVLTNDIDLSDVTADDFKNGSLIGIVKSSNKNVFVVFDGNGYSLKGLNVELKNGTEASVFGTLNEKSVVKNLKIEKPIIKSTSDEMKNIAIVASENRGTVSGVTVSYPILTAKAAAYTALVVASNYSTISDTAVIGSHTNISSATAESHTLSAVGAVGAIAGLNHGTISNASALNIGMFIPESSKSDTVYGGIVGKNSGAVLNSVSVGNVMGGKSADVAGGIVGMATAPVGSHDVTSKLTNNYTLVAISKAVTGCAVIGVDGTADMITDCFWSSEISGKDTMADDCGAGENEVSTTVFKLIPAGKSVTVSADDVKSSAWGKAIFELDGTIKVNGDSFNAVTENNNTKITATASGKVAYAVYNAKIMLPSNVGASSATKTLKQYMRITLVSVAADSKGDGTSANPFVIKSAGDFGVYKYVPKMNAVLGADIKASAVPAVKGVLDGNSHTVTASGTLVSSVYGEIKNLNILVNSNISSAVFGKLSSAKVSGVSLNMAEGTALTAKSGGVGILFDEIGGASVIDDCRVQGNIIVMAEKLSAVGGFAGLLSGDNTVITSSGAVVSISVAENISAQKVAGFIGSVKADAVKISDCYIGGENLSDKFMFASDVAGKNIKIENITTAFGKAVALDFDKYDDVDEKQFTEFKFDDGSVGFFTGNGGDFAIALPSIKAFENTDFTVVCDENVLLANVQVSAGKAILKVERAAGVVTVKALPVTLIHNATGLSATIHISNGLQKAADGRYIISSAYDLAYLSENIGELYASDFIVTNNIDMSVIDDFAPIGTTEIAFAGSFDGNGKTISNLTIDGSAKVGLFGALDGATVEAISFKNAQVKSTGGYVGVLAGQVTGACSISSITVDGASVASSDLYAGVLIGSISGDTNTVKVSGITINNSSVDSEANYSGAVCGYADGNAEISAIEINGFTANGASYVGGVCGLANGSVSFADVNVANAKLSGVSEISGIAGSNERASITDAHIIDSEISTLANSSANTAGGISAIFGLLVKNVSVTNTKITAGVAGGIVGKVAEDCNLTIKNASVNTCEISSSGANTVVGGILGVNNVKGIATLDGVKVDSATVISGGSISAGIVGDCSSVQSGLLLTNAEAYAQVNGSVGADAIASAGIVGRIGVAAVNNVKLTNIKVGGKVSGGGAVSGAVGLIRDGKDFEGYSPIIADSIVFASVDSQNASCAGMIIGAVEDEEIFGENTDTVISNVVTTSFYGVPACACDVFGGYVDISGAISASDSILDTSDETAVEISGLPTVYGFVFDAATGWASESSERIEIVSSAEASVLLKALRRADIAIVGYYVLEDDANVRVPVSFRVQSTVSTPLDGSGTENDPYLINNAYDLETMAQYADKGAYFVLTQDIEFTDADFQFGGAFYNFGKGVVSIGNEEKAFNGKFTGLYNGKIHSISGMQMQGNDLGGLFGVADGAVITDLVINGADISANVIGGVLVGKANATVIKNVTISNSSVDSTGLGSMVGGVVGLAESSNVENVTLNAVDVKSTPKATGAAAQYVGGVAGEFDGTVKNITLTDVSVCSDTVAGGVIGLVSGSAYIIQSDVNADVNANIAAAVVGRVDEPSGFGVSATQAGGKVYGTELASGVIGEITAASDNSAFDKLNRSLVRDTVVTAVISGDAARAVVIGEVADALATQKENKNADVFSNVYYSSYTNSIGAFGAEHLNAYRNGEYNIINLSALSYCADGDTFTYVPLSTDQTALSEDSIILGGGEGNFKSFTAGGRIYELLKVTSNIDGLVDYDEVASAVKLNCLPQDEAKLVFVYNGGLELAIDISAETQELDKDRVSVNCALINATGNAELSDKLVAVMLKTRDGEIVKSADFFTALDSQDRVVGAYALPNGKLYIDMHLPVGCKFSVNAVDENGNALSVEDAGNEGAVITVGSATSISVSVTIEKETAVEWGLRALWSVIGK